MSNTKKVFKSFINSFTGSPCTYKTPKELKKQCKVHGNANYFPPSHIIWIEIERIDRRFNIDRKILSQGFNTDKFYLFISEGQNACKFAVNKYIFTPYTVLLKAVNKETLESELVCFDYETSS